LLAAELVVRWAVPDPMALYAQGPGPEEPIIAYDPILHWRLLPDQEVWHHSPRGPSGVMRTNALGLRDDPFPPSGDGDRFTGICLGDSSTWGDGVSQENTYAELLEDELAEAAPPGMQISVLNAGVPGYSTAQGLKQAGWLLDRFSFDLLVISFLPSDVFPAEQADIDLVPRGMGVPAAWMASHSRLVSILRLALSRSARVRAMDRGGGVYHAEMPNRVAARPDFERQLTELVDLARSHGAEPLLLTPMPFCIDAGCPTRHTVGTASGARDFMNRCVEDEPAYREVTAEVARTSSVRHVDLAEVVAAQPSRRGLYVDEIHPSAGGHALIAGALAPVALEVLHSRR